MLKRLKQRENVEYNKKLETTCKAGVPGIPSTPGAPTSPYITRPRNCSFTHFINNKIVNKFYIILTFTPFIPGSPNAPGRPWKEKY